ncbi:MAG: ABC transporter substrate-binding protein [Synergistaceae bacterium]|nr:ABC transporter substrate-binding protein [Synergistaceae bacterium]
MNKRTFYVLGILVILLTLSAGGGYAHHGESHKPGHGEETRHEEKPQGEKRHGEAHQGELTKIIVADTKTTHHLNLYVAKELGLFEKHHLDVAIKDVADDEVAQDLVLSGGADVFWSNPALTITAVAAGQPIKSIAQSKNTCTSMLVVKKGSPVKTLADLNHKVIAATSPTCETFLALSASARENGSLIHAQKLDGTNALKALEAGEVDGAILEEPYLSIAELQGYRPLFHSVTAGLSCCTINASERTLASSAGALKHFIMAIDEANALIDSNPIADDIVGIAAHYTNAPKEAIVHGNRRLSFASAIDKKGLNLLGDNLLKAGVIKKNPGDNLFAEAFKGITW